MTLEFLSTLNGQVYQTIQEIINNKKGLVISIKAETNSYIFDVDCDFFQTFEGLKVKDGKYNYFISYCEIREVHEFN